MMSKQEIIEIASKEFSESHENTVKEREEYSQRLINVLTSSDCHVRDELNKNILKKWNSVLNFSK